MHDTFIIFEGLVDQDKALAFRAEGLELETVPVWISSLPRLFESCEEYWLISVVWIPH